MIVPLHSSRKAFKDFIKQNKEVNDRDVNYLISEIQNRVKEENNNAIWEMVSRKYAKWSNFNLAAYASTFITDSMQRNICLNHIIVKIVISKIRKKRVDLENFKKQMILSEMSKYPKVFETYQDIPIAPKIIKLRIFEDLYVTALRNWDNVYKMIDQLRQINSTEFDELICGFLKTFINKLQWPHTKELNSHLIHLTKLIEMINEPELKAVALQSRDLLVSLSTSPEMIKRMICEELYDTALKDWENACAMTDQLRLSNSEQDFNHLIFEFLKFFIDKIKWPDIVQLESHLPHLNRFIQMIQSSKLREEAFKLIEMRFFFMEFSHLFDKIDPHNALKMKAEFSELDPLTCEHEFVGYIILVLDSIHAEYIKETLPDTIKQRHDQKITLHIIRHYVADPYKVLHRQIHEYFMAKLSRSTSPLAISTDSLLELFRRNGLNEHFLFILLNYVTTYNYGIELISGFWRHLKNSSGENQISSSTFFKILEKFGIPFDSKEKTVRKSRKKTVLQS